MALVAAMRPNSKASSTMGMKKSVVATMAWVSFSFHTAASSLDSMPTSSPGKAARQPLGERRVGQDLLQHRRRDLAAAAAAMGEMGESDAGGLRTGSDMAIPTLHKGGLGHCMFQEDETQNDVPVFGHAHVGAQLVRRGPEGLM
jgi:hypothetical protein